MGSTFFKECTLLPQWSLPFKKEFNKKIGAIVGVHSIFGSGLLLSLAASSEVLLAAQTSSKARAKTIDILVER